MVECQAHVGTRLVADGEIFFAHLAETDGTIKIDQKNFVFTARLLSVLDVGRAGDGTGPEGDGPKGTDPAGAGPGEARGARA